VTNDEYRDIAREQRRRQEEDEFRRRSQEQYFQQERERHERDEAQRLAHHSHNLGRMGAIPPLGGSLDGMEYQKGLWEYQRTQRAKKQKAEAEKARQQTARHAPFEGPAPEIYIPLHRPPRRRFIGGITHWFVNRVWPFSAILAAGYESQDTSKKTKLVLALVVGLACTTLLGLPAFYVPL
jgi:hypothetical protein